MKLSQLISNYMAVVNEHFFRVHSENVQAIRISCIFTFIVVLSLINILFFLLTNKNGAILHRDSFQLPACIYLAFMYLVIFIILSVCKTFSGIKLSRKIPQYSHLCSHITNRYRKYQSLDAFQPILI